MRSSDPRVLPMAMLVLCLIIGSFSISKKPTHREEKER